MNTPSSTTYENILLKLNKDPEIKSKQINYYPNSNKIAVIVDPRFNPLMEAVIRNFMYFMNPQEWNLCIISYSGYKKLIKTIFPNCIFKAIDEEYIYFNNNVPNIKIKSYNEMFLNTEFWKSIPGEHILIFQTDCIMYKMFPDYFLQYDYCGANYYFDNSFFYGGINGGCSLRKKSVMIECIEKINWNYDIPKYKSIIDNLKNDFYYYLSPTNVFKMKHIHCTTCSEDVFFTHACEILRKNVPDKIHRNLFATEVDTNIDTCIYHGWNKNYHTNIFAIEILKKSVLFNKYMNHLLPEVINIPILESEINEKNIKINLISEKSIPILENINNIAD